MGKKPLKIGKILRNRLLNSGVGILVLFISFSLSAGYFSNRRSAEEMDKARSLVAEGKIDDAIKVYQSIIEKYPDSDYISQAWLEMGKLQYQKQAYDKSANSFEQARKNPGSKERFRETTLWLGRSYFQLKNYQRVIDLVAGAYDDFRDQQSKIELSEIIFLSYKELKNYKNAILWLGKYVEAGGTKELEKAKALVPEWLSTLKDSELEEIYNQTGPEWIQGEAGYILGIRYYESNRLKEAKEIMQSLLKRYPDNAHRSELKEMIDQAEQLLQVVPTRIGLILPLSGAYKSFGERALKGALLAAGIFHYPKSAHQFELRVEDSYGDPELAKDAVKRMIINDHIIALVGPILNPVASAVAEVSEQLNVPMIALSPAPGVTDKRNYIFRNCMTKQSQVNALLDWAIGEKKFNTFAVLYPDDKYGNEFAQIFAKEVRARGAELIKSVSYAPEETDLRDAIAQLEPKALKEGIKKDPKPIPLPFQALFIPESYERIGIVVPQLLYYRMQPQLLGTSGWHSEKIFEHCRESYLEKAVFPDLFYPELTTKEFDDYRFKYQQAYNEDPSLIDLQAYESVAIIIELIEKQKITSRKELLNAIKSIKNWQSPLGPVSVNASSEFEHPLHIFRIEKGKFVKIK